MASTSYPAAVIAGTRNQDSLPIVTSQILHEAGLAPVPYTGRNFLRKFLRPGGLELALIPYYGAKA